MRAVRAFHSHTSEICFSERMDTFSADIRRFAQLAEPLVKLNHGYGFQNGGCYLFAEALVRWSRFKLKLAGLYGTIGPIPVLEHVYACYDQRFFIDSQGLTSAKAAVNAKAIHAPWDRPFQSQRRLYFIRHSIKKADASAIHQTESVIDLLHQAAQNFFPPFEPALFGAMAIRRRRSTSQVREQALTQRSRNLAKGG